MAENEIKNTTEKHKIEAEIKDNSKNTIKNKKLTIMGLSVWRIMAYRGKMVGLFRYAT